MAKQQDIENIKKAVKVTLSIQDTKIIADIAEKLGIPETEVLRKGLRIMDVYTQGRDEDARLLLQKKDDTGDKDSVQELLII